MNRYVAKGLVEDMRVGKKVLFVAENQLVAHEAFRQTLEAADADLIDHVYRSRGAERILAKSGGSVRFLSVNSKSHRGLSTDVVFLHNEGMPFWEYLPMLAVSAAAELIRV